MLRALAPLLLPLAAACGSSTTRSVSGQLQAGAYPVDNPVVIAQGADHRVFITHVNLSGSFKLNLPTGVSYRLLLANTTGTGYSAISRIHWPIKTQWANLGPGGVIELGMIHPSGTSTSTMGPSNQDHNSQGENDDDQGQDEDDGAAVCNDGNENDSDCGDDNAQGNEEGMTSDDNQDQNEMDAESNSASMCACGATHQASNDDDNAQGDESGGGGGHASAPANTDGGCPASPPSPSPPVGAGGTGGTSTGSVGSPCTTNSGCSSGLACVASTCQTKAPPLF
jgi:hypothetical protein